MKKGQTRFYLCASLSRSWFVQRSRLTPKYILKLVEGEEAVAAVDDVGEDDETTKIDFFAVAVR
jgi:hypothetical protein